jgi:hypothetical protein
MGEPSFRLPCIGHALDFALQPCQPGSLAMAVSDAERARQQHHPRKYQGLSLEDLEERPGCARVSRQLLLRKYRL